MGESTSRHLEVPTFIPDVLQTFVPLSLTSALLLCFKSALSVTFPHGDLWNFRSLLIMAGGRRMDAGRRSREGPSKEPDFLPSLPVLLLRHGTSDSEPNMSFDTSESSKYMFGLGCATLVRVISYVSPSEVPKETIPHQSPLRIGAGWGEYLALMERLDKISSEDWDGFGACKGNLGRINVVEGHTKHRPGYTKTPSGCRITYLKYLGNGKRQETPGKRP
nr:hypothetical protein [Tanacetum cinerariifolium]